MKCRCSKCSALVSVKHAAQVVQSSMCVAKITAYNIQSMNCTEFRVELSGVELSGVEYSVCRTDEG